MKSAVQMVSYGISLDIIDLRKENERKNTVIVHRNCDRRRKGFFHRLVKEYRGAKVLMGAILIFFKD
ncbi:MAG: hypothetical protein ACOC5S_03315 [Acidobacteriota bacterium]